MIESDGFRVTDATVWRFSPWRLVSPAAQASALAFVKHKQQVMEVTVLRMIDTIMRIIETFRPAACDATSSAAGAEPTVGQCIPRHRRPVCLCAVRRWCRDRAIPAAVAEQSAASRPPAAFFSILNGHQKPR